MMNILDQKIPRSRRQWLLITAVALAVWITFAFLSPAADYIRCYTWMVKEPWRYQLVSERFWTQNPPYQSIFMAPFVSIPEHNGYIVFMAFSLAAFVVSDGSIPYFFRKLSVIVVQTADSTEVFQVEGNYVFFSPDGSLIVLGRKYLDPARWTLGRPMWLMAADGSAVRQAMEDTLRVDYDFTWSLDGKQIAFVRFDIGAPTNPPELWLVNADGSNPLELVVWGYAPAWVP